MQADDCFLMNANQQNKTSEATSPDINYKKLLQQQKYLTTILEKHPVIIQLLLGVGFHL